MPNVLSPRDLVSRPDNMDETVLPSLYLHFNQYLPYTCIEFSIILQIKHMWKGSKDLTRPILHVYSFSLKLSFELMHFII